MGSMVATDLRYWQLPRHCSICYSLVKKHIKQQGKTTQMLKGVWMAASSNVAQAMPLCVNITTSTSPRKTIPAHGVNYFNHATTS